ncbi:macrophage-expressed gene 1 protein-like [Grammomys surdaster]|uniref:macrophage-expressed gene 1 protein-like n=1 Tax=Grammomys surdaster TaxID=491861 RepID=UPI00109FEC56|nr:macrophage-expressed gene 1 protein-like [Grammomys surdaster]
MNSFIVTVLIWTTVAYAEVEKALEEIHDDGFQKCQNALHLPVLEVLPGGGWDNLRNVDMGQVVDLKYTKCKTTEDGQYIIPDEVFTIPQKESNLEMNSEILESWQNYRSTTSFSINMNLDYVPKVNGKFSTEFQRIKTIQVRDHAVTTRAQVRNLVYTVKTNPNAELSLGFKKELMEICDRLEKNQTKMATYLAELLVLNYGTHVITSVDAGAALVQEDHIRSSYLKDNKRNHAAVAASAGFTFAKVVNFKIEAGFDYQNTLATGYLANRTNSRVQSIGGIPFYPGMTIETWQQGIVNHLVAVDRAGLPLHFFIKPEKLPGFPHHLVEQLAKTVETAAKSYYNFNTFPGCTNINSPNFNFEANTDDGSCDGKVVNSPFGGVYQLCAQSSGQSKVDMCLDFYQRNPLTGGFSCPSGYTPVHLLTQTHEKGYTEKECRNKCTLKIFCHTECKDVFRVAKAEVSAYWCVASSQVADNSGILFGGVFTDKSSNPMTNAQSCPTSYFPLKLFENLKVCVSLDHELGPKSSVPFGGFFSCSKGNPLYNSSTSGDLENSFLPKCPGGFSQQLAVIIDGCQVSYCVKAGIFTKTSLAPARLPPYTQLPMSQFSTDPVEVTSSESAKSWVKDPYTLQWRLEEPLKSGRLSGGSTAGITIVVILALGILTAMAIYGNRRFKKNESDGVPRRQTFLPFPRARATPDGLQDPNPA